MREQIKEIMKRDLMPFPNKQDNLEYTEEDVILIAETFAKEFKTKQEEKINYLKSYFNNQIKWFKEMEEEKDESYTYDESHEQFDRSDCYTVLQILSED